MRDTFTAELSSSRLFNFWRMFSRSLGGGGRGGVRKREGGREGGGRGEGERMLDLVC